VLRPEERGFLDYLRRAKVDVSELVIERLADDHIQQKVQ